MARPHRFSNDREALDFVASRIADEAQREGVPLSEIERKMLYFSETAWTLPDIQNVNDEFDREYNQIGYEKKISELIRKAVSVARKQQPEEFESWTEAARQLSKEERYLLVMIKQAGLRGICRRRRDAWKRWAVGGAALAMFEGLAWLIAKLFPDPAAPFWWHPRSPAFWAATVCVFVGGNLVRLLMGHQTFDKKFDRAVEWFFGASRRNS